MKKSIAISFFWLIFFLGNVLFVEAKKIYTFEEGKSIVDSLVQQPWENAPFDEAEDGQRAIEIAQQIGYKIGEARALIKLGHNYRIKYEEEKSLKHIIRAKEILDQFGTSKDQLQALHALAEASRFLGHLKKALDYAKMTINLAEQLGDSLYIGRGNWVTAMVHLHLHQNDKYFAYGEQALDIFKKINNAEEMANAYTRLGCIDPDYEKRFAYFAEAEKMLPLIKNERLRKQRKYVLYSYIAIAHLDKKDYIATEGPTKIALQIAEEIGNADGAAILHSYLAKIYFHHYNNYPKAIEHAQHHLAYEKSIGRYWYVIPAAQFLMDVHSAAGQPKKALEYSQEAMLYQDSLYWANRKNDVEEIEKAYELEKKYAEIANLETEQRIRTLIGIGSTAFFLLLAGFFYRQRQLKNRHLKVQEKFNQQLKIDKETIEKQKEDLAELNKTKDRFFAIIAHDMRNAVYNFRGVTDKISFFIERKQPERIHTFGNQINTAVNNLTNLMDNLLEWAMLQKNAFPYHPENIELKRLCGSAFNLFENTALKKGIKLDCDISEKTYVYADKNALSTILRNLLSNSIKYSSDTDRILITANEKEKNIEIIVKDTGLGIAKEEQESLFSLGNKKPKKGTAGEKGSGLGLVMVKELIAMNGSHLSIESELNKGTTIRFLLPKAILSKRSEVELNPQKISA